MVEGLIQNLRMTMSWDNEEVSRSIQGVTRMLSIHFALFGRYVEIFCLTIELGDSHKRDYQI